ncbi:MAG: hypothetical protein LQ338_006696 [Usnochroma carphineum]|nr:MAG: hypothetical protein LQ338_006696 [Usnochroma carphineum]
MRKVVALAGVGDLGKYVCEELLASPDFDVVVLSRGTNNTKNNKWFRDRHVPIHTTDYTASSLLSVLDATHATALISFINIATPLYISVHVSLLEACRLSRSCKRLIPSEWVGDIDTFPLKPDYYATTREPFRHVLKV